MKKLFRRLVPLLALFLGLFHWLKGYALSGQHWANGNIVVQLQFGSPGGTLIDGNTSWNQVVEDALALWNPYLNGVQFTVVRNSNAPIARGNGFNNAFFSNTVYGDTWGSFTIGIALSQYIGNTYTEGDVIFNSTKPLNSYRGPARYLSDGSYLVDVRRLALHEFGHVLGLGHSSVSTAIMYPTSSDTDNLTLDDTNGVAAIYGSPSSSSTSYLANLSSRALVQTNDKVLIGGVVIIGTTPKRVLIRAIGPSLASAGVAGTMQDPVLELYDISGNLVASNDNWQQTQQVEIQSTGKAPSDGRESAILMTLNPGNYTAIIRGKNNTSGVALVEVYDLDSPPNSKLANISTRAFVGTNDNVLIGGVVIIGTTPKRVLIRAIAPTLAKAGVAGVMQDPVLELYDVAGHLIASNDNWQQTQAIEIQNTGKAPIDPRESAILTTLSPSNYTAIIRGKNNTTGIALVEVYDLD